MFLIIQIYTLQNSLQECQKLSDKREKDTTYASDRVLDMEKDRKDLNDEFVILRTNYLELRKKADNEVIIIAIGWYHRHYVDGTNISINHCVSLKMKFNF